MARVTTTLFGNLALIPAPAVVPCVESLQFLTDMSESNDGSEQNIQLRTKARQTLQYQIPLKPATDADVFNTGYGALRKKWAIPLWIEAQPVGTVANGATLINCITNVYDFRNDSLAFLFDITGKYQVLEISTFDSTKINLSSPIVGLFRSAYLMPCRIGRVSGSMAKQFSGYSGNVKVQFFVEDTLAITGAEPTQYLSNDIYFEAGLFENGSTETEIEQRNDIIDFNLGVSESRTPWLHAKHGRQHNSQMRNAQEIRTYKEFLYRRAGKSKVFWMPTFLNDLRLQNTGNIVSTIVTYRDSYLEYTQNRVHIAIEAGGVWYPRIISAPTPTSADTMQFTIDSPLNVDASTVTRISYLGLYRLDSDSIDLNYGSSLLTEASVRIKELLP